MLKLTMYGADADVLVMSPGEYQLACHMNEPKPKDFGNFVMSPMPGTLISFGVQVSHNMSATMFSILSIPGLRIFLFFETHSTQFLSNDFLFYFSLLILLTISCSPQSDISNCRKETLWKWVKSYA